MKNQPVWFNGKICNRIEANVNILSPTAQFGLNVFEGIRAYWSKAERQLYIFRLKEHLRRLLQSCALIRIDCPWGPTELEEILIDFLNQLRIEEDVAIRMTIYVDGEGSWSSSSPIGMFIAPITKNRTTLPLTEGKSACVSTWHRLSENSMSPRIKSGANYINSRYAHLEAVRNGYDLPLLFNDQGSLAEGAGACVFIIRDGQFWTPSISSSILESITRDSIIEYIRSYNIVVSERTVTRTDLYTADEVFLCGSAAEITPITSIDQYLIGNGEIGKCTQFTMKEYLRIVTGDHADYMKWLTPVYKYFDKI